MVALIAPAANAVVVEQTGMDFAAPLALELDLASTAVTGELLVTVRPDAGFFNQGVQHEVVVDLPAGMVFNTNTNNDGDDAEIEGDDTDGAAATGNIFTGGDQGDSQVTFQIAPNDAVTQTFIMTLPVQVESCLAAGSGINVTVSTAGGFVNNDADGDNTASAADAPGFGGCASGFNGSVTSDFPPANMAGTNDTFLAFTTSAATNYRQLDDSGDAVLGEIEYAPNPNVSVTSESPLEAIDPATDITRVVSTIELAGNPSGPGGADLEVDNGTITGGPVTWTVTQTGAEVADGPAVISIGTNGDVLPTLQPVVTASTVTFDSDDHGFISNEPGATGALEVVDREGETFGVFDWNSGPAGAQTLSVYRITGLPVGGTVNYTATIWNSNTGGPGAMLLPQASVTGDESGEAVLVSTTLPGLPAGTVRYDLGLNFETARRLDVDRLLATGGVVTAFNGGANADSTGRLNFDVRDDADNVDP